MLTARQSKHTKEALLILKEKKKKWTPSGFLNRENGVFEVQWEDVLSPQFFELQQTRMDNEFPRIRTRWLTLAKSRADFEAEIKLYFNSIPSCYYSITLQFQSFQGIFLFVWFLISFFFPQFCPLFM